MFVWKRLAGAALLTTLMGGFAVTLAVPASAAPAAETIIFDKGNLLTSSQEAKLTSVLHADDEKYGLVFAVDTVNSLKGESVEDYALRRANSLELGAAGKDNGALFVISIGDRVSRIELGKGVEAKISDDDAQNILNSSVLPKYHTGDYYGGIVAGADQIGAAYTDSGSQAAPSNEPAGAPFPWGSVLKWAGIIVGGIIVLVVGGFGIFLLIAYTMDGFKRRKQELESKRGKFAQNLAADFHYGDSDKTISTKDVKKFRALPDEDARRAFMEPYLSAYLTEDPKFATEAYEAFYSRFLEIEFSEWRDVYNLGRAETNNTVGSYSQTCSADEVIENFRVSVVNLVEQKRLEAEERKRSEERRRKAAEVARVAQEKKDKEEQDAAEKFWGGLTEEQKATIKEARTKKDKVQAIGRLNQTSMSDSDMFPVLFSLFAVAVGQPVAEVTTSHSSSSSHSSSYSSPSSDFSSFSGGGFDGGGVSGGF